MADIDESLFSVVYRGNQCGECGGTGEIVNDGPYSRCDDCNGTGFERPMPYHKSPSAINQQEREQTLRLALTHLCEFLGAAIAMGVVETPKAFRDELNRAARALEETE